jgi:hypothetical protein
MAYIKPKGWVGHAEEDEDLGQTVIDPYGHDARRNYNLPQMREFPAPPTGDSDAEYDPGILGPPEGWEEAGLRMDPGYDDPRAQAIDRLYKKPPNRNIQTPNEFPPVTRDPQMMTPGMKTEQDYQQQFGASPDFSKKRTIGDMMGMPYGGEGTASEQAEAADTAQMSDEDLLSQVQRQMVQQPTPGSSLPPDVNDQTTWPDSPEEFEQMFGRPPTTDTEVEFYFGEDNPDDRTPDPPDTEMDIRRR